MSQSLVIFSPQGKVEYQLNTKISPFNEFISSLVNETVIKLDTKFFTNSINLKRFYGYTRENLYAALYFDAIITIDSEKIKSTLSSILITFDRFRQDDDLSNPKLDQLISMQFNKLILLKTEAVSSSNAPQSPANSGTSTPVKKSSNPVLGNKKMRKWDGGEMVEVNPNQVLDYSQGDVSDVAANNTNLVIDDSNYVKQNDMVLVNELKDILREQKDEDDAAEAANTLGFGGKFLQKISGYLGGTINVEEVSKKFYDQLVSKNVAAPIAKTIIDKINQKLTNQSGVTLKVYKQTLVDELTKILTPNVSTDLLYDIKKNASNPRPYVISVVGVNGVGKSTNLAKLAYWFLQNNLNVLICACDTFRSGAVEQLKVHVNNLQKLNESSSSTAKIDIFEKGYGSGDHVVATAKLAIQYGGENNFDIVLIDTAGRTHSNTRLMAPLKKFGDAANPNKIIMVGEALVGTDSVEQAINFNNAFGSTRNLDFFIISKVDTVGDLIGAMINMVMATNVPILFVGTGQTYSDIKRLSIATLVDMLMS